MGVIRKYTRMYKPQQLSIPFDRAFQDMAPSHHFETSPLMCIVNAMKAWRPNSLRIISLGAIKTTAPCIQESYVTYVAVTWILVYVITYWWVYQVFECQLPSGLDMSYLLPR